MSISQFDIGDEDPVEKRNNSLASSIFSVPVPKTPLGILKSLRQSPNVKKMKFRNFNESLGNPFSRITDKRVPITPYQQEYHDCINKYNMMWMI